MTIKIWRNDTDRRQAERGPVMFLLLGLYKYNYSTFIIMVVDYVDFLSAQG